MLINDPYVPPTKPEPGYTWLFHPTDPNIIFYVKECDLIEQDGVVTIKAGAVGMVGKRKLKNEDNTN